MPQAHFYTQNNSVGIGMTDPDSSAIPDISSTGKELLIPRMTTAQIESIMNPKGSEGGRVRHFTSCS